MTIYYTGDRSGLIRPGMTFNLQTTPPQLAQCVQVDGLFSTIEMYNYFQNNFHRGVARHGIEYLLHNNNYLFDEHGNPLPYTSLSPAIEVIFEFVRQIKFPELPSRFECAFACEDPSYPRNFFKAPNLPVYEITGNARTFKADMTFLKIGPNHLATFVLAEKYWSGTITDPTQVEILIECPATIGARVL